MMSTQRNKKKTYEVTYVDAIPCEYRSCWDTHYLSYLKKIKYWRMILRYVLRLVVTIIYLLAEFVK